MVAPLPPNLAVTCSHCGKDITFPKPKEKIPQEISLHCLSCGRRKFYPATTIRPVGKKK
jgi:RNase P subunit RPR2